MSRRGKPVVSLSLSLLFLATAVPLACAPPEASHESWSALDQALVVDGRYVAEMPSGVTAGLNIGSERAPERDPVSDEMVLDAADNTLMTCPIWHVDTGGSDTAGDGYDWGEGPLSNGVPWRTLHHAMWALMTRSPRINCGTILLHYSSTPYPARSDVLSDWDALDDMDELQTFIDGEAPYLHMVIRGELDGNGNRPKILFDSSDQAKTFLTIRHKRTGPSRTSRSTSRRRAAAASGCTRTRPRPSPAPMAYC